jgi:hypothetical protein
MTSEQERDALSRALAAWLDSQEADPKHAIPVMLTICATMMGRVANTKEDLLNGIRLAEEAFEAGAMITFISRK